MDEAIIIPCILLAGVFCQFLSWLLRIPAILFLLAFGILAGPVAGWLQPQEQFGDFLKHFISLSVALILFEGSLELDASKLKVVGTTVRKLITVGVMVTGIGSGLALHLFFDVEWEISLLFGCLMTVSGPTVVQPMLRSTRPSLRVAETLRWEGILVDPIGAVLTVLAYEFVYILHAGEPGVHFFTLLFSILLTGLAGGYLIGKGFGVLLRYHLIPEHLQNATVLALVVGLFVFSNQIAEESGLISVTVAGITLRNMKGLHLTPLITFKESVSVILISTLFLLLASQLNLQDIAKLGWAAPVLLVCTLQFIVRPLCVMASTVGEEYTAGEKTVLSWVAPRGIVAAVVASLLAGKLEGMGFKGTDVLVEAIFIVILGTVAFESLTLRPLAVWLKVALPTPRGILIVGSNEVARLFAKTLEAHKFRVTLADSSRSGIREARLAGLKTYLGNPMSEHAEANLNLIGVGKALMLTEDLEENVLCALHFSHEIGRDNVYRIHTDETKDRNIRGDFSHLYRGYPLFDKGITINKVRELIQNGATFKATSLTAEFGLKNWEELYKDKAHPFFAVSSKGEIQFFVEDGVFVPSPGWTVVSLQFAEKEAQTSSESSSNREKNDE